jgi:hypothetical protein
MVVTINNDPIDLVDFASGESTPVKLELGQPVESPLGTFISFSYWTNILDTTWTGDNKEWVDPVAAAECLIGNNGNGSDRSLGPAILTLTGLDSNEDYSIEILSARDHDMSAKVMAGGEIEHFVPTGIGQITHSILNGEIADRSQENITDTALLSNWNVQNSLNNKDWLIWDEASTNSNGDLLLSFELIEGGTCFVNAIRLTPVPEPATFVLFFVGGLVARRQMAG